MTKRGPRGPVPIYQVIVNAIRADIDNGVLRAGQALPTEAELGEAHGASRLTVRKALAILREEGVIYTVRPEGSYVGPEDAPKIREPWPFEKVAAAVAEGIKRGGYQPDEVLPSETEMMEEHGVAKKTVRAALALLREQGWVYTVPAIGTFVASRDKWPTTS
ncbi:DNA-binding GntR family transcriptional regulator [Thermocatellispora tengchongensis]|uniref:DNA-binding GntR family transcriptional regulator n=1 Tax=Thermocatellispora tengchongensis TaxID=1073253 RepID=A0A840PRT7_9ACTN|nr:winged helix-turn-helix domain-containing protein [Thermocatellispora tengchongensis]MBB5140500.1 DNA-binding GntR family transcriptional regulator [Thermocatellispora tengchongensis]